MINCIRYYMSMLEHKKEQKIRGTIRGANGHGTDTIILGVPVVVPCTVAFWIGRFELVEHHRLFVQRSQSETVLLLGVTWGAVTGNVVARSELWRNWW